MAAAAARSRAGSSRRPRRPRQISSPGSPVPSLGRLCRRPPPWRNAMHRCVQHPDLTAHTLTLLTACTASVAPLQLHSADSPVVHLTLCCFVCTSKPNYPLPFFPLRLDAMPVHPCRLLNPTQLLSEQSYNV